MTSRQRLLSCPACQSDGLNSQPTDGTILMSLCPSPSTSKSPLPVSVAPSTPTMTHHLPTWLLFSSIGSGLVSLKR